MLVRCMNHELLTNESIFPTLFDITEQRALFTLQIVFILICTAYSFCNTACRNSTISVFETGICLCFNHAHMNALVIKENRYNPLCCTSRYMSENNQLCNILVYKMRLRIVNQSLYDTLFVWFSSISHVLYFVNTRRRLQ